MTITFRPACIPDKYSEPFFSSACIGHLVYQRCKICDAPQLGRALCEQCGSLDLLWHEASGKAKIHSFTVMHLAYHPSFKIGDYFSAIVELEEGVRLPVYAGARDEWGSMQVGDDVVVGFEEGEQGVMLPKLSRFIGSDVLPSAYD